MEVLKSLRKQQKVNQEEIAKLLNVTTQAYSRYERGERELGYDSLIKLADYFDVSVDYLIEHESKSSKDWTDEERALGVGNHPTYLSEDEYELIELRSEIIRIHGEGYWKTLETMMKALINVKPEK